LTYFALNMRYEPQKIDIEDSNLKNCDFFR
jgi:hypothetical protein